MEYKVNKGPDKFDLTQALFACKKYSQHQVVFHVKSFGKEIEVVATVSELKKLEGDSIIVRGKVMGTFCEDLRNREYECYFDLSSKKGSIKVINVPYENSNQQLLPLKGIRC